MDMDQHVCAMHQIDENVSTLWKTFLFFFMHMQKLLGQILYGPWSFPITRGLEFIWFILLTTWSRSFACSRTASWSFPVKHAEINRALQNMLENIHNQHKSWQILGPQPTWRKNCIFLQNMYFFAYYNTIFRFVLQEWAVRIQMLCKINKQVSFLNLYSITKFCFIIFYLF